MLRALSIACLCVAAAATSVSAEPYCPMSITESSEWKETGIEAVEKCLAAGKANGRDINEATMDNLTMLNAALLGEADPEIIKLILDHGADPNHFNEHLEYFNTPLMQAASGPSNMDPEYVDRITILLAAGADPNTVDNDAWPAYSYIFFARDTPDIPAGIVELLHSYGANFSKPPKNGLSDSQGRAAWVPLALVKGTSVEVLKEIQSITGEDLNVLQADGNAGTSLHIVADFMHPNALEVASWLMENGVDPSQLDADGKSAWEMSATSPELAALLKSGKPDANGGIAGLASGREISNACRTPALEYGLSTDGATVDEVCLCAEQQAPIRFSRIKGHSQFAKLYGSKSREEQLDMLMQDVIFGCRVLWSKQP